MSTCLDWSLRYAPLFRTCRKLYNYQYASRGSYRPAGELAQGVVGGDLANLSHVPSGLFDLIVMTDVFEHVPYFWKGVPTLGRLVNVGGFVIVTVPFMYDSPLTALGDTMTRGTPPLPPLVTR